MKHLACVLVCQVRLAASFGLLACVPVWSSSRSVENACLPGCMNLLRSRDSACFVPSKPAFLPAKYTKAWMHELRPTEGIVSGTIKNCSSPLARAPLNSHIQLFTAAAKSVRLLLQHGHTGTAVKFASGTVAAMAATILTQPADVVRTRMQLAGNQGVQRTMVQTFQHAVQTGGARALLSGTTPRVSA